MTRMRGGEGDAALHAYHDGELTRLTRWVFERRLRRSPELRRELEALRTLRRELRASDAAAPGADLWDAIALRLPAADAVRSEAAGAGRWASGWRPLTAAVAATGAALALAIGLYTGETAPGTSGGVIQWIDSGDHAVMVLEGDDELTVIWVFDDVLEGAALGGFGDAA
jgi:anti-sigma factor RsiW